MVITPKQLAAAKLSRLVEEYEVFFSTDYAEAEQVYSQRLACQHPLSMTMLVHVPIPPEK
jgi:hypothetical protein